MAVKVGINGFGRIGRSFTRAALKAGGIDIVAVNDLGNVENLAYLLKYDSVYGPAPFEVKAGEGVILAGDQSIKVLAEKEPRKLPWKDLGVDIVVESTGLFTEYAKAKVHLDAGAKRVVISAPAKGDASEAGVAAATVLMGVNEPQLQNCPLTSNASCTTNAASPLIAILDETLGIEKALLTTTHAYTASQAIVDGPSKKDLKEGRAAAINIVPTSTGAAIAITKALPQLEGKFDGISLRVPVPAGSIVDVTFIAKRDTSAEEVNELLKKAAADPRWKDVFTVTEEELVSSDIVGSPYGSIADLGLTRVVGGNLVKVLAWYDNEAGYTHTLVKHVMEAAKHL